MNNNILMLLPFLMGQSGNNSIPMELISKMLSNNNANMNPMMLMMLSMMSNKNKPQSSDKKDDSIMKNDNISSIFGGDVASMLKLFMEFTSANNNKNHTDK